MNLHCCEQSHNVVHCDTCVISVILEVSCQSLETMRCVRGGPNDLSGGKVLRTSHFPAHASRIFAVVIQMCIT